MKGGGGPQSTDPSSPDPAGARLADYQGNEYIYIQGNSTVASTLGAASEVGGRTSEMVPPGTVATKDYGLNKLPDLSSDLLGGGEEGVEGGGALEPKEHYKLDDHHSKDAPKVGSSEIMCQISLFEIFCIFHILKAGFNYFSQT